MLYHFLIDINRLIDMNYFQLLSAILYSCTKLLSSTRGFGVLGFWGFGEVSKSAKI